MVFVVNLFRCQIDGLPLNPDALSSIPVIRVKNGVMVHIYNFIISAVIWEFGNRRATPNFQTP